MSRNRILGTPQNTNTLPAASGSVYNETYQDDVLIPPFNAAPGAPYCTINLNGCGGAPTANTTGPADGDTLDITDGLGVLSAGTPLVIQGRRGGVGFQIANGGALQDSITLATAGASIQLVFSGAANCWIRGNGSQANVQPQTQATWFVDPVNGNDSNNGATAGTALKTMTQLVERLSFLSLPAYTVNILNDVPATDVYQLEPRVATNTNVTDVSVTLVGQRIQLTSSTVQAAAATSVAGNTQATITDATITWANFIGRLITVTSGASAGATAWVLKDLGGGVARVSNWWNAGVSAAPGFPAGTPAVAPLAGDKYQIDKLTVFGPQIAGVGGVSRVQQIFTNLECPLANLGGAAEFFFITCSHTGPGFPVTFRPVEDGIPTRVNCNGDLFNTGPGIAHLMVNYSYLWTFSGVAFLNTFVVPTELGVWEFCNCTLQGGQLVMNRATEIIGGTGLPALNLPVYGVCGGQLECNGQFGIAVWDSPATQAAIWITSAGKARFSGAILGSGNTGFGLRADTGSQVLIDSLTCPAANVKITGTAGDMNLDNAADAIPALVAGAAVPAAAPLGTWAQFFGAPFNGQVVGLLRTADGGGGATGTSIQAA